MANPNNTPARDNVIIAHRSAIISAEIANNVRDTRPDWTIHEPTGMADTLQMIDKIGGETACVISGGSITTMPENSQVRTISDGTSIIRAAIAKGVPDNLILTTTVEDPDSIYEENATKLQMSKTPYTAEMGIDVVLRRSLNSKNGAVVTIKNGKEEIRRKVSTWLQNRLERNRG